MLQGSCTDKKVTSAIIVEVIFLAVAAIQAFAKQNGLKVVNNARLQEVATKVATGEITDISQIAKMIFK